VFSETRVAGGSIEPGVELERNPRINLVMESRARVARRQLFIIKQTFVFRLSHAPRAPSILSARPWGSATLHPRLYAYTRYAGFGKIDLFQGS
jgi:hypothetical protein